MLSVVCGSLQSYAYARTCTYVYMYPDMYLYCTLTMVEVLIFDLQEALYSKHVLHCSNIMHVHVVNVLNMCLCNE